MPEHYHWTAKDYGSVTWKRVRAEAFARSGGMCVCGLFEATVGHHIRYPHPNEITADDVVGLCGLCHDFITQVRKIMECRKTTAFQAWGAAQSVLSELMPGWISEFREAMGAVNLKGPDRVDRVWDAGPAGGARRHRRHGHPRARSGSWRVRRNGSDNPAWRGSVRRGSAGARHGGARLGKGNRGMARHGVAWRGKGNRGEARLG